MEEAAMKHTDKSGPWLWSLTSDQHDHLFSPPASPPVADAEYLLSPPVEEPAQAPEVAPTNAYTVDHMLAMAEAGGLHYPLYMAIKSSDSSDATWWMQIYREPGADPECIDGTPMCPPYAVVAMHEWDESIQRARSRSLWLKDGKLKWIDWRTRGGW